MAHQLTQRGNGFVEMAYAGDTPWHGLGQKVTKGASIDEWQVQAGMDWTIEESPVEFSYKANGLKVRGKVVDKKVLYRSDTFAPLGTVGDGYNVVQPHDVLGFFRDLTDEAGFSIETAGTLFGGRRFWALAHIGDTVEIVPGDKVGGYLLLCTGADGTLATMGKFTTVRVVCNNTLSMACGETGQHKVSHKSQFNPNAMKQKLGIVHKEFDTFAANMKRLSDKSVSMARAERLAFDLLKPADFETSTDKAGVIEKVSNSRSFKGILAMFEGGGHGSNIDGVRDTAWGFVNAVTEYVDHASRATSVDNRLNSAWFGAGDDMKNRAVDLALAF
jgi:phage/plasmid-like protein (TIGR03299 family)